MLPLSLESATVRMMRPESIAREPGMFGHDFVDHFGGTRDHEVKAWNEAVTNWEGELLYQFFSTCNFPLLTHSFFTVERYLELA